MIYIDADEIDKYHKDIMVLRNDAEKLRKEKFELSNDLKFLKDSGEEILVIVKDNDNKAYEYKSTEKELLSELVSENKQMRISIDELSRLKDNIENQKQMLILKYHEISNKYTTDMKNQNDDIKKLLQYINYLEDRPLYSRIKNIKKDLNVETYKNITNETLVIDKIDEPIKTIYSTDELNRLKKEAKKIQKPRGWHFREKYVDSVGNVYFKGELQPHLKE